MSIRLLQGDCREVLATLDAGSIDACVTDPPYHLTAGKPGGTGVASLNLKSPAGRSRIGTGFMGKAWDGGDVAFQPETWAEVLRVLKPGAHLAAFGGTRTFHRVAVAIEDAGFEIRDTLCWLYGSGFPKSHNQPGGWGTALKPAWEPIILARKPLVGTVAGNMAAHGTGALNIDGCRVGTSKNVPASVSRKLPGNCYGKFAEGGETKGIGGHDPNLGRWPANVAHDGSDEVLEAFARFGEKASGSGAVKRASSADRSGNRGAAYGAESRPAGTAMISHADTGSAARFFYEAKASREERGEGNNHPTVKPLALMRWLCRLVTPPGGTVLDPFLGSGSTALAADQEGFHCIGIEQSAEYLEIARRRLATEAPLFTEVA